MTKTISPIAHIRTEFPDKFGIPRQSGLVPALRGRIIFEKDYRREEAIRGIEDYSHLWLIFGFSENETGEKGKKPSLMVTPPRLGGKEKKGVFATRASFRPNGLGLSCVTLEAVDLTAADGPALIVGGADLLDGTPIYDIKPYLPYADAYPTARGSFGQTLKDSAIPVTDPEGCLEALPEDLREKALSVLCQDPRAAYQKKPGQICGLAFAGYDIRFTSEAEGLVIRQVVRRDGNFQKIKEKEVK